MTVDENLLNQHSGSDRKPPYSFLEIYLDELKQVAKQRCHKVPPDPNGARILQSVIDGADDLTIHDVQASVLKADLCGLAISGGGIRSATFGLGVLQGLAAIGLLSRFNYMSTVSGGGYIGAWFSAWIKREGYPAVKSGLLPQSLTDKPKLRTNGEFEVEANAIRHLRLYSNYLAPRPGLLSFDGWVLIAIYLRNLLLNQTVLALAVLALFLSLRSTVEFFSVANGAQTPGVYSYILVGVTSLLLLLSVAGAAIFSPGGALKSDFAVGRRFPECFWSFGILPWLAAATGASLLFCNPSASEKWFTTVSFFEFAVVFSILHAVLGACALSCRREAITAGAVAGLIGGSLYYIAWEYMLRGAHSPYPELDITVAAVATFGVPVSLTGFVLTNFLTIGFCGPKLRELEREWWSSLNARLFMLAAAWGALFTTSVFGPWLVGAIWLNSTGWYQLATSTTTAGVLGILASGLKLAQSAETGSPGAHGWKETLVAMTPPLFLATILLLFSTCLDWLAYDVYAAIQGRDDWRFHKRLVFLLTDLNSPKDVGFIPAWIVLPIVSASLIGLSLLAGNVIGVNIFSLQHLYENRLVRCYLGASKRSRSPDRLVNMDPDDDFAFSTLFDDNTDPVLPPYFTGPFYIINGALNIKASTAHKDRAISRTERDAEGLQFLERQAESFVFTPLHCGSDATGYCSTKDFAANMKLGTAVAVSGAAVSPNMGYHSYPSVTALLTFFNVRLGAWFGNPRFPTRTRSNPAASALILFKELAGITDAESEYVYVSDGGHFENMGIYELIRRRCRFIVAVDSGSDSKIQENFGRVVRQVRIDFGIWIEVDLDQVTPGLDGRCASHVVVGRIHYGDVHPTAPHDHHSGFSDRPFFEYEQNQGIIVWIKNSLTGDEPADLKNFAAMDPSFPYDPTTNQFFNESLFESYRALGLHSVMSSFTNPSIATTLNDASSTREIFERIHEVFIEHPKHMVPNYVHENEEYAALQKVLRSDEKLSKLARELYEFPRTEIPASTPDEQIGERLMALEMFTVLENVWISLNLDRYSDQPLYEGWMNVFRNWSGSARLQSIWTGESGINREFSPAFRRFIDRLIQELGTRS